jgi:hypothetical protein
MIYWMCLTQRRSGSGRPAEKRGSRSLADVMQGQLAIGMPMPHSAIGWGLSLVCFMHPALLILIASQIRDSILATARTEFKEGAAFGQLTAKVTEVAADPAWSALVEKRSQELRTIP